MTARPLRGVRNRDRNRLRNPRRNPARQALDDARFVYTADVARSPPPARSAVTYLQGLDPDEVLIEIVREGYMRGRAGLTGRMRICTRIDRGDAP